ncbi:capsular polysaccharide biosynthesis protein [Roseibium aquae]|uniref:Capsular polysaccharide biosynthesis protein n=1 Tax=Roseibium aquae TaxID=1323746 RepID=A0A916X106_9HYPH|nr:capsular biosynthesis protein [Roseibium aquae]GGB48982.1 capsular polysaccharide biosynthesis protein [Roseibium aquae]
MADTGPETRRVLFLQGPLSPLYRQMGLLVRAMGHEAFRINICAGDWLHWHGPECTSFKGRPQDFGAFVGAFMDDHRITDLVLHGDQRIYHRAAIGEGRDRGVYVAVTELGMIRPGWMTLERNGLSTVSHFPRDPSAIRRISEDCGPVDRSPAFPSSFWLQTVPDVIYNLANVAGQVLYPHYQRHTIYHPVPEYLRGGWRLLNKAKRDRQADAILRDVVGKAASIFLLPLQLEGDFQLRRHSPYQSFSQVIGEVVRDFAAHAPPQSHLILKSHPLDIGVEGWGGVISSAADQARVKERVHFLDGGHLDSLFQHVHGVVTVNSTAGLDALIHGIPVKTLVPAHYDIEGMTHQGGLSGFWNAPQPPDMDLCAAYLNAIAATIQVRGSIHNKDGVPVAARNMVERILARTLNEPGGYLPDPPRLEPARRIGVPL